MKANLSNMPDQTRAHTQSMAVLVFSQYSFFVLFLFAPEEAIWQPQHPPPPNLITGLKYFRDELQVLQVRA